MGLIPELTQTQWRDAEGEVWQCRVSTPVMQEAGRLLGIAFKHFQDFASMTMDQHIGLVWLSVRESAAGRGISKAKFLEERLTLPIIGEALPALANAVRDAFPQPEDAPEVRPLEPEAADAPGS